MGNVWVLAEALQYAVDPDNNPNTHDGADVINMSLSTLRETRLLRSVLSAVCDDVPLPGEDDFPAVSNPNLVVVAAAGNGGDTTEQFPAAENINGLLAVGASTQSDTLASFSTRGSWIKVVAPGQQILSTVPDNKFGTWSGTSMAAPIAAGEAALVRAVFPALSGRKIVSHIEKTSQRIQGPIQSRIDIGAAVTTQPEIDSSTVQFSQMTFSATEGDPALNVVVTRTGSSSTSATVRYQTADTASANNCAVVNSLASSRCDYLASLGTLLFAPGETSKTISIPLVDDVYAENSESFSISLSGADGAGIGTPATSTLTINDNDTLTGSNPIDTASFFVRQHYLDFLNREPDANGLSFWTNEITSCGANVACMEVKRINVSAAFFLSIEFQETGYLVYRTYKVGFGVPISGVPIQLSDFLRDTQQIGKGVQVGVGDWQSQLDTNKQKFALAFVQRPDFLTAFPNSMTADQFVNQLDVNAGIVLSATEKSDLVAVLGATPSDIAKRVMVLRSVAEDPDLRSAEFNKAFVLMQYFGYLRRNPNDAPDSNFDGYNFWLNKLNQFNGNFVSAELVKAFLVSDEYKHRFGP